MTKLNILALPGTQAGNIFYTAQLTFKQIVECFEFQVADLPIEDKYQRELNLRRAKEFCQYLLNNFEQKLPYVIPSLTASVTECNYDEKTGILEIPDSARAVINDGQHRRAGIEEAILINTELALDTVSVMLILDPKLKRAQQIFSDINFNAKPVTKSLSLAFNKRDSEANATQSIFNKVPLFYRFTEREKQSVTSSATKVFVYSILHSVISKIFDTLMSKKQNAIKYQGLIAHYWNCVAEVVEPYKLLLNNQIVAKAARADYICTHSVCLDGLAQLGQVLLLDYLDYKIPKIKDEDGKERDDLEQSEIYKKLLPLQDIDWQKTNYHWNSRVVLDESLRIISNSSAKNFLADYFSEKVLGFTIHKKADTEKNGKRNHNQLNLLDTKDLVSIK